MAEKFFDIFCRIRLHFVGSSFILFLEAKTGAPETPKRAFERNEAMKSINGTVEYTYKNAEGKEITLKDEVKYPEFETAADIVGALDSGNFSDVVDGEGKVTKLAADVLKEYVADFLSALNYGLSLKARAKVRTVLQAKAEGPDKSINKMVAELVKNRAAQGKPISEEKARAMVLAQQRMLDEEAANEQTAA